MPALVLDGPAIDPLEAARRLAGRPGRFLLHSASDADGVGKWSFVGAAPARVISGSLAALDAALAAAEVRAGARPADPAPRPLLVGFLAYDLGRTIEPRAGGPGGPPSAADAGMPDVWFGAYDAVWRCDAASGRAEVVGAPAAAAELHAWLSRAEQGAVPPAPRLGPLLADEPDERHLAAVRRVLDYIGAGDVYQVNLARRLRATLAPRDLDALAIYERVAAVSPAPYGALIEAGDVALVSDSPELFLRRAPGQARVETRPIKGTRARGKDPARDAALAAELRTDAKELAEHLMIVDLLRNDLGRVAKIGSVRVDDYARLVSLPTVHHLISTVSAEIDAHDVSPSALLAATFPGGSITGAPKIRAMQIIDELEPCRRGAYTGAFGYLGAEGAIDLAIAIRTAVVRRDLGELQLHVGGGIVADSEPARELEETEEKAAAWRRALGSFQERGAG